MQLLAIPLCGLETERFSDLEGPIIIQRLQCVQDWTLRTLAPGIWKTHWRLDWKTRLAVMSHRWRTWILLAGFNCETLTAVLDTATFLYQGAQCLVMGKTGAI